MLRSRLLLVAFTGLTVCTFSSSSAKVARTWNDLVPGPRVIRYDAEKDQLIHQHSVFTMASKNRPGGEHAYTGNRLEAFQFHGKRGRGGVYDALEDYKLKLDPRNYRYRHR